MTSTAWTFPLPADRVEEGIDLATFSERLLAYESDFTRWWTPRFASFGMPPAFGEPLLSWDATTAVLDAKEELS
ncbi:hypothetical protein [Nocardia sp. NPDC024068]|uniref:hypothetical protein n=1 Tax=Nocardia sp. NPDC024068 TaxID=3157197 RepID=UPI0033FCB51E